MNFRLRPWTITDLPSLVKYANNREIAANLTDRFPFPYNEEHGKQFITMATSHDPMRIFAIEVNGEAAGGIGLHPQDDVWRLNAELGYWLAEPYWGNGIISAAIAQTVHYGFNTLPIQRIFARPFGRNLASQKVLEKNGFVLESTIPSILIKNGVMEDELVYGIRKIK